MRNGSWVGMKQGGVMKRDLFRLEKLRSLQRLYQRYWESSSLDFIPYPYICFPRLPACHQASRESCHSDKGEPKSTRARKAYIAHPTQHVDHEISSFRLVYMTAQDRITGQGATSLTTLLCPLPPIPRVPCVSRADGDTGDQVRGPHAV